MNVLKAGPQLLAGNLRSARFASNVVGIRREDKNEWERRVPLTPTQVKKLVDSGIKVLVQPSNIRAFTDSDYADVGAEICESLNEADTILAVKEVPAELLIPNKTYMMFSHTHKAQPYNMPLLDTMLQENIRLVDFERIAGDEGRIVKFGPFAGFAGTIDTIHALGVALLARNFATPFLHISNSKEYRSLDSAREDLIALGNLIRTKGLPRELGPLTFVVTGTGSVSQAAQQILHHLPCQYVEKQDLKKLCESKTFDNKTVYITVVSAKDMVEHKDPEKKFDKAEYYKSPENFIPTFHKDVAPYAKVIINGMYWEEKYPRLLTVNQTRELSRQDKLPLLVLGEITCDPYGSIEFFTKSTSIAHPTYCYCPKTDSEVSIEDFDGQGPLIVGVDHLPAEFPVESSHFFGEPLVDLVKGIVASDASQTIEQQQKTLAPELYNAIITAHNKLTPNYEYISDLRKARDDTKKHRNILFLGAGMVSGPAVEYLLKDPRNSITLADMSVKNAEAVLEKWAGNAFHAGRDPAGRVQSARAVSLDVTHIEHLTNMVKGADVVISLVPWTEHPKVMNICIDQGVPCCTASYVSPGVAELHDKAEAAGVTILNEMGVDPGIDIMSSFQLLDHIRAEGGVVRSYESFCGALPEPEAANNCLGYKFSWSPKGVLLAAQRPCTFKWNDAVIDCDGPKLYDLALPFTPFNALSMEWVPNGNALNFKDVYGLHDAHTILRATLRFGGFSTVIKGMRELGMLEADATHPGLEATSAGTVTWKQVVEDLAGTNIEGLPAKLTEKLQAARDRLAAVENIDGFIAEGGRKTLDEEVQECMKGMEELGLFEDSAAAPKAQKGSVIDALAETLNVNLAFEAHENDFVIMYHRVKADYPHGVSKVHTATMTERGSSRLSATANTVGLPVAIGAQLVLDGQITKAGIVRPITKDVYNPVMRELEKLGVKLHEKESVVKASSA